MLMTTHPLTMDTVRPTAQAMLEGGWRFLTQSLTDRGEEGFDLLYHFDKDLEERIFRLAVPKGTAVPSISSIYFAALLVENENQDLFGLTYDGLIVDFNRTLYLEEAGDPIEAPFCKISAYKQSRREE